MAHGAAAVSLVRTWRPRTLQSHLGAGALKHEVPRQAPYKPHLLHPQSPNTGQNKTKSNRLDTETTRPSGHCAHWHMFFFFLFKGRLGLERPERHSHSDRSTACSFFLPRLVPTLPAITGASMGQRWSLREAWWWRTRGDFCFRTVWDIPLWFAPLGHAHVHKTSGRKRIHHSSFFTFSPVLRNHLQPFRASPISSDQF